MKAQWVTKRARCISAFLFLVLPLSVHGQASNQPTDINGLERWIHEAFPDWRSEDVDIVLNGIADALQETAEPIPPDVQSQLIAQTPELIMHNMLSGEWVVPSDYPLFVASYRYDLENYLAREPMSEDESVLLEAQIEELYQYGLGHWEASAGADVASTGPILEKTKEMLLWDMHSPFSPSLKKPFTEEQLQRIRESMDEWASDYIAMQQRRDPSEHDGLALDFAGYLFDGLSEEAARDMPPITEEMKALLKRRDAEAEVINRQAVRDFSKNNAERIKKEFDREQASQKEMLRRLEKEKQEETPEPVAPAMASVNAAAPLRLPESKPDNVRLELSEPNSWRWIAGAGVGLCLIFGGGLYWMRARRSR